jgi:Spy/CpxP family protein refolding chaperone
MKYVTKENPHYSKIEKKIKEQQKILKLEEQNLIKQEKMIQTLKSSGFNEKDINILLTLRSNDSKKGN